MLASVRSNSSKSSMICVMAAFKDESINYSKSLLQSNQVGRSYTDLDIPAS
jgi:hypothetical protein